MSGINIESARTLIGLIENNFELLKVPSFSVFKGVLAQIHAPGTGCTQCRRNKIINTFSIQYEMSMRQLGEDEKKQIKDILKVEQICYTLNENNVAKKYCF